jgi:hypothetical protein
VAWRLLGQEVEACATENTVQVCRHGDLVETHV